MRTAAKAPESTRTGAQSRPKDVPGETPAGSQAQFAVSSKETRPAKTRRVKDNDEFAGFARRMLRAFARRAAADDPWVLREMVDFAAEVDVQIVNVVGALVAQGYTWQQIGDELGITRSTAFRRYAARIEAAKGDAR